ncbi:MAG: peptide deformylase [Chitinivibrionia bacterium]|nr:peptide deformylase [Chitinivibrionia bacterium]
MDTLDLRIYGDPVLRKKAARIELFDEKLKEFAAAMIRTMIAERGIGLAAPQVGISKRLIIALGMRDLDDASAPPLVLANPVATDRSSETWSYEEGCLSVPGISAAVIRPNEVSVAYQDLAGEERTISAEGIFARILLHEIDHLDGTLFIDHLSSANKSLAKSKLKRLDQYKHLF